MRVYSYLYHMVLALFLLGISIVVLIGSTHNLRLRMLPWTGETLTYSLLWGGIIALVAVLLAVFGWFRYLFPIWALIVFVLMFRGYFLSPYTFASRSELYWVMLLVFGALVALLGSLTVFRSSRPRRI